jgi:hypothetical protein
MCAHCSNFQEKPAMKNVVEKIEPITIFRNENGSPVGIIIAQDEYPEPLYGAFIHCVVNGWRWLAESTDKEKVYHEAREYFHSHTHFCPGCEFDFECQHSYNCKAQEADQTCEACQSKQQSTEAANITAA